MKLRHLLPFAALAVLLNTASGREYHVYFGTYTGAKSKGIYVSRFDTATGRLTAPDLAAETRNPSFLTVHPRNRFVYATGELSDASGMRGGAVSAFAVDRKSGQLTLLNQQSSAGAGPCHAEMDRTGRCLLVANYGSGSIAALPIHKDGSLGEPSSVIQHQGSSVNPKRQAGPHAHCVNIVPGNRFALCCDLGLDQVLVYGLDPKQPALTAHDPPFATAKPGAGPRHLAFAPNGKFVYVINELDSTLTAFAWNGQQGVLRALETVPTVPDGPAGQNTCAEVGVHPSGRFVYGSNRGHDSIAVFAADTKTGKLSPVEHQATGGRTPRHFAIDPTGRWLLAENQASDSVLVLRIDPASGRLAPTGQKLDVPSPVCAVFVPAK